MPVAGAQRPRPCAQGGRERKHASSPKTAAAEAAAHLAAVCSITSQRVSTAGTFGSTQGLHLGRNGSTTADNPTGQLAIGDPMASAEVRISAERQKELKRGLHMARPREDLSDVPRDESTPIQRPPPSARTAPSGETVCCGTAALTSCGGRPPATCVGPLQTSKSRASPRSSRKGSSLTSKSLPWGQEHFRVGC